MWAVKSDIILHLRLPPRGTKIHEEDVGKLLLPYCVVSGMLYGFIREGPLRAAKTMRMALNAKGP